jgi:flagellar motor switch protein FliN
VDTQRSKKPAQIFAAALAATLSESLTAALGFPWPLKVVDSVDLVARKERPIHFRLTVDGALEGECFVEFYERQVADLGAKLSGQPAAEFSDEHAEALEKIITAAMPALAASLSSEYGKLIFKVDRVGELAFGGMFVVSLGASVGERQDLPVLVYFDGQLLESLSNSPSAKQTAAEESAAVEPANLKLVMDVELNVSLRFGQRRLPLREVLELASGSVIELDRQVDEPIELLLDGKLIARGEAVIVDGNYGLRVTEIPQPMASHFLR